MKLKLAAAVAVLILGATSAYAMRDCHRMCGGGGGGDHGGGHEEPAPIPLPAAGLLLLAGVGGLAAVRKVRK